MKPGRSLAAATAVAAISALWAAGCGRHVATADECRAVLDRLVELELHESGYRDATVAARWKKELAARFASDLRRCRVLRVRDDLRACLKRARTAEDVTHHCLD